jgi:hypothetical protein
MTFTLISIVVKTPSGKISLVFSFERRLIMGIVSMVTIMSAPGRVSVIGMSRVMSFKKAYSHLDLGISRIDGKTSGYDQQESK